jgi:hypothetical protein
MALGHTPDAGVLQQLSKERPPNNPLRDLLKKLGGRQVTIREVTAECISVSYLVLQELKIYIEPTKTPTGYDKLLDAFSSGARDVFWSSEQLKRADRAVIGHAIANRLDVLTTDGAMKARSLREFLRRMDHMPDAKLPSWYIPEITVVRCGMWH